MKMAFQEGSVMAELPAKNVAEQFYVPGAEFNNFEYVIL